MPRISKKERKENTYQKTFSLFKNSTSFIVVDLNNVTSLQLQNMKQRWRGTTDILLGKNTVIKKALSELVRTNPQIQDVINIIKNNLAFIFTTESYKEIKDVMVSNSRDVYAGVGMIAQKDVWIEKHVTSMGPERTPYFQALNIFTQITKGKVEIKTACKALTEGEKVGPSQANLLTLLDIKPFTFYMKFFKVYEDGMFYDPWVVDVDEAVVGEAVREAVKEIASLSLGCGFSCDLSVPYEIINSFRELVGVSLASGFVTKESEAFN